MKAEGVRAEGNRFAPCRFDIGDRFSGSGRMRPVNDDYGGAGGGQTIGDRFANARTGTGNERTTAFEREETRRSCGHGF
jgi:hypothetical protein